MMKSISVTLSLLSVACVGFAQQPLPKIEHTPIQNTSPASGQQMFSTYCAVCHGSDGKGNGPAAVALKIPPSDLTTLSRKNNGVFPSNRVFTVLQSGVENPAHGTPEMPIWGALLHSVTASSSNSADAETKLRIYNLIDYLKQIQQK